MSVVTSDPKRIVGEVFLPIRMGLTDRKPHPWNLAVQREIARGMHFPGNARRGIPRETRRLAQELYREIVRTSREIPRVVGAATFPGDRNSREVAFPAECTPWVWNPGYVRGNLAGRPGNSPRNYPREIWDPPAGFGRLGYASTQWFHFDTL